MALKDKLMTLEDFKAVRDVDVASNSAQFTEIKADLGAQTGIISKVPSYYINLTTDPVDIDNPSPSSTGLTYSIIDCSEGDKFVINAIGATNGRAWGFLDSSNHVLSMADANTTVTDLELMAPTNAVKLIINDKGGGISYKVGNNLVTKVSNALSDEAKDVLIVIFRNVAFVDGNGDSHIRNLQKALGLTKTPLLLYEASEGLPGTFDGITVTITEATTGGANEQISGNELIAHVDKGPSGASNAISYAFDSNLLEDYGEISIVARINPSAYKMAGIYQDGVNMRIATQAGATRIYICGDENGKARIVYYVSANEKTYIDTNYDLKDYHKYCLKMESATQHKFEIDGETILNRMLHVGPSTPSTTGITLMAGSTATDGMTANIRRFGLYGYID